MSAGAMSETLTDIEVMPYEDDDNPDHLRHVVRPADNGHRSADDPTTAQDVIDLARLTGTEVVALCGFRFVPKANPARYATCQECIEVAAQIVAGQRP